MKSLNAVGMWLMIAISAASAVAQTPPVSTPTSDDRDVVKISTNIIQLDVTVTDSKGRPITDLRPDEMRIFENGREKAISGFTFIPGTQVPLQRKSGTEKKDAKQPLLPSRPLDADGVRRTVAIVVDDLHLSFASAYFVKDALRKFIQQNTTEGDLIAVFRTGSGGGSSQQFTSDRRQLLAAVDRLRYNHQAPVDFITPIRDSVVSASDYGQGQRSEVEQLREDITAEGTIGSLMTVIRSMRELPGRKSVVLLTDNINIYDRDAKGRQSFSLTYEPARRLIDFANRSSVAIYPVHGIGLAYPGITASDDITGISGIGGERITSSIIADRIGGISAAQDGLRFLAENTGGIAHVNNNDLEGGIRRAVNDQSYYLVAYDPDTDTFDRRKLKYNKFDVKVSRPGARVRFRSGFLNVSEEQRKRPKPTEADKFVAALFSPFITDQIEVRMNAVFAADAVSNSTVRSFINIDTSGLSFDQQQGLRKTSFDLVAFTFGMDGEVVDQRARNFTITVTDKEYESLRDRGLVAAFNLLVKKAGGYQVRLAVRDKATGRLGSAYQFVEVPSVKSGKLTISGMILSSSGNVGDKGDVVSAAADDPLRYTAVRQFRAGTPLHFAYVAYNPKLERGRPNLTQSYKLYKDNQVIFTGQERSIAIQDLQTPKVVGVSGGIVLGKELLPGDYVLEIVVKDAVAKRQATQFIQFEVVH